MTEDLRRRVVLLEHAADVEDGDAVAHLHRLVDVVGDEHDRLAHLLLKPQELVLQPGARDGVDGAERLVHEQHRRIGRERARDADTLALTAGQLRGIPLAVVGGIEARRGRAARRLRAVIAVLLPAEQARDGGDVRGDRLVREQADLLDHVARCAGGARPDRRG